MNNILSIVVNGERYTEIIEYSYSRDLNNLVGVVELVIANYAVTNSPIKQEDDIVVFIDDEKVMTGYVEVVNSSYSTNSHNLRIVVRDRTADIVETTIGANFTFNANFLAELFSLALQAEGLGYISVIDDSDNGGEFISDETQSAETGDSLFEFMDNYARKSNKALKTDANGNLVIFDLGGVDLGQRLSNEYNDSNGLIKSASLNIDYSNRYSKIIIQSQSSDDLLDGGDNIRGEATDENIRRVRTKTIIADETLTQKECENLAKFEVNKRRAESIKYTCENFGFYSQEGIIWDLNQIVSIVDLNSSINSKMLLQGLSFSKSIGGGTISNLSFVSPDVYSLITESSDFFEGLE